MKKQFILFCILVLIGTSIAGWTRIFGGENWESSGHSSSFSDGYYLAGSSGSYDFHDEQMYIVKTNHIGGEVWSLYLGGSGIENVNGITTTHNEGCVIVGLSNSFRIESDYEAYIVCLNAVGDTVWTHVLGEINGYDSYRGVCRDIDNGYLACGITASLYESIDGFLISKYDTLGNLEWYNTPCEGIANDLCISAMGDMFSVGERSGTILIVRTEHDGSHVWDREYGEGIATAIKETPDGDFIVVGVKPGPRDDDYFALKIDTDGTILWENDYATDYTEQATSLLVTGENEFIIGGHSNSTTTSGFYGSTGFMLKTNDSGDSLWHNLYGGLYNDYIYSLHEIEDGFIISGKSHSYRDLSDADLFIMKTDTLGIIEPESFITTDIIAGWNLLSYPMSDTVSISSICSRTIPPFFCYSSDGYDVVDSIWAGRGYWILAEIDTAVIYAGDFAYDPLDITLYPGWNLVGGNVRIIDMEDFFDANPELVAPAYGYNALDGYYISDEFYPGLGYWILSTDTVETTID